MKKQAVVLTVGFLIIIIGVAASIHGQQAKTKLGVSVRVPHRIRLQVHHQVDRLTITRQDIENGYVDVVDGTIMSVTSNSNKGFLLSFILSDGPFTSIIVKDGGRHVELLKNGGIILLKGEGSSHEEGRKQLSYRFYLSRNVKERVYPWPLIMEPILLEGY